MEQRKNTRKKLLQVIKYVYNKFVNVIKSYAIICIFANRIKTILEEIDLKNFKTTLNFQF